MSSVYFLVDKTLGKYRVLEHIGHGGMSEVYKGQQAQLERMVAIKVLHPFLADDEGFVVRFQREARIVATLRHPNIVQVYDFDYNEDLGIYYMVMEYIAGATLKDRLNQGPFQPDEAVRITAAVADALDYAHQRGMVHRDVKPANIMFLDNDQPVLADFGIAKMLTLSGLTASGAMVGTPAYMAPEVGMGKQGGASSDIYSLGVVLYQMVTGHTPFDAESPMGVVMKHISEPPPPPSKYIPTLAPALEAAILRVLAKDPQERYATAGEMAAALRQAVGQRQPPVATAEAAPRPDAVVVPSTPLMDGDSDPADARAEAPLIKTWPPPSSSTPADIASEPTEEPDTPEPRARERRIRALPLLLSALLIGLIVWLALDGTIAAMWPGISLIGAVDTVPTATPTIEPTRSNTEPTPAATATPAALSAAPTVTQTVSVEEPLCRPSLRIENILVRPSRSVAPETTVVGYITLRNAGACPWPEGMELRFVSGLPWGAAEAIPLRALPEGSRIQLVVPARAPEELGDYQSVWQVHTASNEAIGGQVKILLEVVDTPALTPVPTPAGPLQPETVGALEVAAPLLLEWSESQLQGVWSATMQVQVSGGSGTYRYYLGQVREETRLVGDTFQVIGRRCNDAEAEIWVLSGTEAAKWQGPIPYPDPEVCQ